MPSYLWRGGWTRTGRFEHRSSGMPPDIRHRTGRYLNGRAGTFTGRVATGGFRSAGYSLLLLSITSLSPCTSPLHDLEAEVDMLRGKNLLVQQP